MAESPMATAPLRAPAAFSTMTTRRPFARAQWAASKAAPQPAIPPPRTRTSVSTTSVSGCTIVDHLARLVSGRHGEPVHHQPLGLAVEFLRLEHLRRRRRSILEGIDGPPGIRSDGELEALHLAVPVLGGPHDGVGGAQRGDRPPQGHHV